jgi:hypothetical protein
MDHARRNCHGRLAWGRGVLGGQRVVGEEGLKCLLFGRRDRQVMVGPELEKCGDVLGAKRLIGGQPIVDTLGALSAVHGSFDGPQKMVCQVVRELHPLVIGPPPAPRVVNELERDHVIDVEGFRIRERLTRVRIPPEAGLHLALLAVGTLAELHRPVRIANQHLRASVLAILVGIDPVPPLSPVIVRDLVVGVDMARFIRRWSRRSKAALRGESPVRRPCS